MGTIRHIKTVVTVNRVDCCADRLANYEVRVGNDPDVKKNPACPGKHTGAKTIACDLSGRYLGIIIPGVSGILTLCEVEAYEA